MNPLARSLTVGLVLSLGLVLTARAQQTGAQPAKYWIFLQDKIDAAGKATVPEPDHLTDRARRRRQVRGSVRSHALDAPLSPSYLAELRRRGVTPLVESRWLNAVSAVLAADQVDAVRELPFVRALRPVGRALRAPEPDAAPPEAPPPVAGKTTMLDYGPSQTQLDAINDIPVLERGINGAGVRLGFLDTEFGDFEHPVFARLVAESRLIAQENFTGQPQDNRHGRSVASIAVGFAEGQLIGPAYGAEVLAATTEFAPSETNQEEDHFVAGLEWLEAGGVDVVNMSLGYSTFDGGQHSYTTADLDGDTGITTRAADLAASLGVVVVASAGNESCSSPTSCWYFITTPADGDSVIAVGAVNSTGSRASFSGRGPTADGRVKPDVAAMGVGVINASFPTGFGAGSGTSFSSPLVAGVVCQMLQVNPTLNPVEVREILRATASQTDHPDNDLGWGIIDADAAVLEAERCMDPAVTCRQTTSTATESPDALPDGFLLSRPYPNPFTEETAFEVRAPAGAGFARMSVYNLLGQRVGVPFEGTLQPGVNRIVFRADGLPPGLYLYALKGDRVSRSGKMVLVR